MDLDGSWKGVSGILCHVQTFSIFQLGDTWDLDRLFGISDTVGLEFFRDWKIFTIVSDNLANLDTSCRYDSVYGRHFYVSYFSFMVSVRSGRQLYGP